MTSALAWLNDLIQWLGRWIPRLLLIHPTHRGVRFGPGGRAVEVGPGLVVYWPITHEVVLVPVTLQSIQFCGQVLPSEGDIGIVPRVTVCVLNLQFTIADPVKAAVSVLHFHALLMNRAQALASRCWMAASDRVSLRWVAEAERDLRDEMCGYGITIESLDLGGLGTGVVLKNISDWAYADGLDGKRPTS